MHFALHCVVLELREMSIIYFIISISAIIPDIFFLWLDHLFHTLRAPTTLKKKGRMKESQRRATVEPKSSLRTEFSLSSVTPSCSASLLLCFLIKLFACQLFWGTDPQPCEKLIPVCLRADSISLGTPSLRQTQGRPWQAGPDQPLEAGPLSTTSPLFLLSGSFRWDSLTDSGILDLNLQVLIKLKDDSGEKDLLMQPPSPYSYLPWDAQEISGLTSVINVNKLWELKVETDLYLQGHKLVPITWANRFYCLIYVLSKWIKPGRDAKDSSHVKRRPQKLRKKLINEQSFNTKSDNLQLLHVS